MDDYPKVEFDVDTAMSIKGYSYVDSVDIAIPTVLT